MRPKFTPAEIRELAKELRELDTPCNEKGCPVCAAADALEYLLQEIEEWRPIETAPKDGQSIWVYEPRRFTQFIAWWKSDFDGEYWQNEADSEPDPSHWRPLPPPPAQQKEKAV